MKHLEILTRKWLIIVKDGEDSFYFCVYLSLNREILTNHLSSFECRLSSSEDDLLSADDVESTGDELDDCDYESPISTSDNG